MSALGQRVAVRRFRIDDHRCQAVLTLQGHDAVGIPRQVQDRIDVSVGTRSTQDAVGGSGSTGVRPRRDDGAGDVANILHFTDFVFPGADGAVLFGRDETRQAADVSFDVRVADRDKRRRDGLGAIVGGAPHDLGDRTGQLALQAPGDFTLQVQGQHVVNRGTVGNTVSVVDVGTADQDTKPDLFDQESGLFAQDLLGLFEDRVLVSVHHHVGDGRVVSILSQVSDDVFAFQLGGIRGDTLSEGLGGKVEDLVGTIGAVVDCAVEETVIAVSTVTVSPTGVGMLQEVTTELNGLAVILGDRLGLTELLEYQVRGTSFQKVLYNERCGSLGLCCGITESAIPPTLSRGNRLYHHTLMYFRCALRFGSSWILLPSGIVVEPRNALNSSIRSRSSGS